MEKDQGQMHTHGWAMSQWEKKKKPTTTKVSKPSVAVFLKHEILRGSKGMWQMRVCKVGQQARLST